MPELDGEAYLRIDRAVRHFEDAWQAGERPSLEALLAGEVDDGACDELLRYALAVELSYRRRLGEVPESREYERRFPDRVRIVGSAFGEESTRGDGDTTTIDAPGRADANGPELRMLADALVGATIDAPSPPGGHPAGGAGPPHDRLGKFVIVGPLGDGGQGSAILARDPDVGRLVVVKRYHAAGDDATTEAKALGRVNSPHAAKCLELMRHEGEPFLVMEYIPGRSLSEVVRQRLPAPREAVRIAEEVAEGLEAVHACGLIHRDVKPSNVILGDDGVARLVDFGLAAHLGSEALEGISGTPPFMPPEQARGQWERIDARSDVYGLGGVLYTLLTGQPPHPGASLREALEHARRGVVTPPRDLKPPRPVPRAIERVVMKALEPDPSRRYASAAELRRALRRSRLRPPLPAALAALAALAILAGLAAWSLPRRGPAPAPTVAAAAPASSPTALSGDLIVRVWSPGYDLRLMSWGDGSGVPTSGSNLVIVATDNNGLLHIRIFDASGNKVTDTAESRLPPTQAGAISALKQQLPGLLPPHVLTGAEKARLVSEATSIVGQTRSPGKDGLSVDEPGALPLRAGEQVHLEARLNRPAYAYLFWIDGQGEVSLLYPRDDGLFGSRTGGGGPEATGSVHSPDALNRGHRMTGPGGLETALLLARREPLPPGTDPVALIGRLPRAPLRDEREVAFLDLEQGGSVATSRLAQYRGIDANQVGEIDDPLLRLMERLRRSDFELIKAVRFAYRGE